MDQFDKYGRYTKKDGAVPVVFLRGDRPFPGELHFIGGLYVRATTKDGGDWGYPDNAPQKQVHFPLLFEGEAPHGILINDGRIVMRYDVIIAQDDKGQRQVVDHPNG
jgi:hypothetical protein